MLFGFARARRTECPSRRDGNRPAHDRGGEIGDQGSGIRDQRSAGVGALRLLVVPVAALLRPAVFLPGSVLERTRTVTLRAASLRTRTLRLSRPLPRTLCLPLLLPGPALRLARTALGVAGAAGPLLLARAVLRRPGTDGARQRLADLGLGPLGHLADLGHDVTALAHESVVDREVVGGGGGGSHVGFPSWGDVVHRGRSPAPDVQRRRAVRALHSAAFCPVRSRLSGSGKRTGSVLHHR